MVDAADLKSVVLVACGFESHPGHMKFSYCSIAFRNQNITLTEVIPFLARVGYSGIELWGNHVNNNADLIALKSSLQANNLAVPMISPYFDFTSNLKNWEKSLQTAKKFTEIASFLECPIIRAFTGTVGSDDADEKQKNDCIEGLKLICEIAGKKDITIALETHPRTLVDNIESTLWLIKEVGAPNLKINLDIYHMFEVHKDPLAALEKLLPFTIHIHAKNAVLSTKEHHQANHPLLHDPNPRAIFLGVRPLSDGEMDYAPFMKALVGNNYQNYVSVEWFGDDPLSAASSELEFLNNALDTAKVAATN